MSETEIKLGDRVRSFDFVVGDFGRDLTGDRATFVEGIVEAIEPVEWCGSGCNHYAVRVDLDCLHGVRWDFAWEGGNRVGTVVYPPTNEGHVDKLDSAWRVALKAKLAAQVAARKAKRLEKDSE